MLTDTYIAFIIERLEPVAAIRTRRMFGALGIYGDDTFFAIVDDDALYFKVDDETRPDYVAAEMPPFMYSADGVSNGYYQVPADILEDDRELAAWARRSLDAARRVAARKSKRRSK